MDEDEETWLTPSVASQGAQTPNIDLDKWLNRSPNVDYSTRSALSRKLKVYQDKKALRRQLGRSTTLSALDEEEASRPPQTSLPSTPPNTLPSSTFPQSFCFPSATTNCLATSSLEDPVPLLAALSLQHRKPHDEEEAVTKKDEDNDEEFLDAEDDFSDIERQLECSGTNGRSRGSRELAKVFEEPHGLLAQRPHPRSSSTSPRFVEMETTPPARLAPSAAPSSTRTMAQSLHCPSTLVAFPPSRQPLSASPTPLYARPPSAAAPSSQLNLHENLKSLQDIARQQEEALRREVRGGGLERKHSWSESPDNEGTMTPFHAISASKSVEFVKRPSTADRTPVSRLPTLSRRGRGRSAIPSPATQLSERRTDLAEHGTARGANGVEHGSGQGRSRIEYDDCF